MLLFNQTNCSLIICLRLGNTFGPEGLNLDIFPTYFYFFLVIGSTLSDRIFYRGQKTEHKKEHEITSLYLALFWYLNLIAPVVEYVHFLRSNLIITLLVLLWWYPGQS